MGIPHTVQTCRWADPTLLLENPLWMAAEDYPWSCHRDGDTRVLATTMVCHTCPRWESRESGDRRNSGTLRAD